MPSRWPAAATAAPEHPSLRAVREETDRLHARCLDLRALIAELTD